MLRSPGQSVFRSKFHSSPGSLGRATIAGKTAVGWASEAKPALQNEEPQSMTIGDGFAEVMAAREIRVGKFDQLSSRK